MVISPLRACALVEPSSSARVKLPINTSISGQAILKISGPWSLKMIIVMPIHRASKPAAHQRDSGIPKRREENFGRAVGGQGDPDA